MRLKVRTTTWNLCRVAHHEWIVLLHFSRNHGLLHLCGAELFAIYFLAISVILFIKSSTMFVVLSFYLVLLTVWNFFPWRISSPGYSPSIYSHLNHHVLSRCSQRRFEDSREINCWLSAWGWIKMGFAFLIKEI